MTAPEPHAAASNSDKLDELIGATDRLSVSIVEYQERAKTAASRFRMTMTAIAALGAVLVGAALATIIVLLTTAADARTQLADCIQPTGHCYQQGQRNTEAAITAITQAITSGDQHVAARAAACAPAYVDLPQRQAVDAIYHCIVRSN